MINILPFKPTAFSFLLRIVATTLGGVIGTVIIMIIFFLSANVLQPAFQDLDQTNINALFIFVFIAMMFVSVLASSMVSTVLTALSEKEKYSRLSSALYQIFILNVIIFVFIAPIYIIFAHIDIQFITYIASLHIILSAISSVLILEILSNPMYAVLGIYGMIFGLITGILGNLLLFQITNGSTVILLFTVLPITWFCLGLFAGIAEVLYFGIYSLYGIDFLRSDLPYGRDVPGGIEEEPTLEEIKERRIKQMKDISGSEFLRKG